MCDKVLNVRYLHCRVRPFYLGLVLASISVVGAKEGDELLRTKAPEWQGLQWTGDAKYTLHQLRGKVVLIRWWTGGCEYCSASAPALNEFHDTFSKRGLVVIGMYHPKPVVPRTISEVTACAERLHLTFPVAIDNKWENLKRYWFNRNADRQFTSVSFLIDKSGLIRYIHPGGEFHKATDPSHAQCAKDYQELRSMIEKLLTE